MASLEVARVNRGELASPAGTLPKSFTSPLDGAMRWQYAVINTGMFFSVARMEAAMDAAGKAGWELVTVYDKAINWLGGMEKGLMLMKRSVPEGVEVISHCIVIQQAGDFWIGQVSTPHAALTISGLAAPTSDVARSPTTPGYPTLRCSRG